MAEGGGSSSSSKVSISFAVKKGRPGGNKVAPSAGGAFGGLHHDDEEEEVIRQELVTTIDSSGIQGQGAKKSDEDKASLPPLVIPVPKPRWVRDRENKAAVVGEEGGEEKHKDTGSTTTAEGESLDELAVKMLMKEATGGEVGGGEGRQGEPLIIPVPARKDLAGRASNGGSENGPMLAANAVPIPEHITDENERFKYELSLREDDIDPDSDVYKTVPVDAFGEALMRGMGWAGPSEDDVKVYNPKARMDRVGLGADPSVLLLDPNKKKKRRGGAGVSQEEMQEIIAKKAQERLKNQKLQVDDIVMITKGDKAAKRAIVLQVTGVPGVDKIEVELEETGEVLRVGSKEVFILEANEIKDRPFMRSSRANGSGGGGSSKRRSRSRSPEDKKKKKRAREEEEERGNGDRSKRSRSRSSEKDKKKKKKKKEEEKEEKDTWLQPWIRVKVVTEKNLGTSSRSYFRKKGVVVEVTRSGEAHLRMDSGDTIQGVKAKYLETALPSAGGTVLILHGSDRGRKAKLIERDDGKEQCVVELLSSSQRRVRVGLDDVAEYSHDR